MSDPCERPDPEVENLKRVLGTLIAWMLESAVSPINADDAKRLLEMLQDGGKPTPQAREHEWQFYMNGSFCKRCGAAIGSGQPCR